MTTAAATSADAAGAAQGIAALAQKMQQNVQVANAHMPHIGEINQAVQQWGNVRQSLADTDSMLNNQSAQMQPNWQDGAGQAYSDRLGTTSQSVRSQMQAMGNGEVEQQMTTLAQGIGTTNQQVQQVAQQFNQMLQMGAQNPLALLIMQPQMQQLVQQSDQMLNQLNQQFSQTAGAVAGMRTGGQSNAPANGGSGGGAGAGSAGITEPGTDGETTGGAPGAASGGMSAAGAGGAGSAGGMGAGGGAVPGLAIPGAGGTSPSLAGAPGMTIPGAGTTTPPVLANPSGVAPVASGSAPVVPPMMGGLGAAGGVRTPSAKVRTPGGSPGLYTGLNTGTAPRAANPVGNSVVAGGKAPLSPEKNGTHTAQQGGTGNDRHREGMPMVPPLMGRMGKQSNAEKPKPGDAKSPFTPLEGSEMPGVPMRLRGRAEDENDNPRIVGSRAHEHVNATTSRLLDEALQALAASQATPQRARATSAN